MSIQTTLAGQVEEVPPMLLSEPSASGPPPATGDFGAVAMRRAAILLAALLLTACTTTRASITPERRAELDTAAQACRQEHPIVLRYDIDRFGVLTAWYRDSNPPAQATAPFFACWRAKLGLRPVETSPTAVSTPTVSPAPPVSPVPANPVGRSAAERLKELDALRQQNLITEGEYRIKRNTILEGL